MLQQFTTSVVQSLSWQAFVCVSFLDKLGTHTGKLGKQKLLLLETR